jgi:hypothetical protein
MPYMVTGSVASSAHGMPRSTRDLDIVIAPTREQLLALMRELPLSDYYADDQQALQALAQRSQFNIIDHATGWKVDFIIAEDSEYGHIALARRTIVDMAGSAMYTASAEDVLIAKLRWAKISGSERQLQDASGIVSTQAEQLDVAYVGNWVRKLGLEVQWNVVRKRV